MKNMKKWILVLGLASQTLLPVSCSGTLTRELRAAFIDGIAGYVQTTTGTLLTNNIPL